MIGDSILHIDFGGLQRERRYVIELSGRAFQVRELGLQRNLAQLQRVIADAPEQHISLSGLTLNYYFDGKEYTHKRLSRLLSACLGGRPVSDGALIKRTLERYLVDSAVRQLAVNFRDRRTLVLSAVSRIGAAEVLAAQTKRVIYGDLLYGFRLGVPLTSTAALHRAAPALLAAVVNTPVSWFNPTARIFLRRMPRFRMYFYQAQVILGGMEYLRRYSPPKLTGKTIITNLQDDEDLEFLRERGVATVIGLLPCIGGRRIPSSLLELALKEMLAEGTGEWELKFLNYFMRENFKPEIVSFTRDMDVEPALIDMPQQSDIEGELPKPMPRAELRKNAAREDEGLFGFILHPLTYQHLMLHPTMRKLDKFLPNSWVERIGAVVPPPIVGVVKDIVAESGARSRGYLYGIPMTPRLMLEYPPEHTYARILQVTRHAETLGIGIVGLGAFTSVVGDAGVTVARKSRIGITTGNSFTVAVTIRTLARAAELMGIDVRDASACVIGATGSIGSILSYLLASEVRALTLVSPRPERLLTLSHRIRERFPNVQLRIARTVDEVLGEADLVVTTTSSVEPVVNVDLLKPGAVVSDVARPPDVTQDAALRRPDVLVIESGEVQLFPGSKLTANIGLPEGVIYACLAETMLLGLEKHYDHFTLGRDITEERVRYINSLADKHGMKLASIRAFNKELTDDGILAVRQRAEDAKRKGQVG